MNMKYSNFMEYELNLFQIVYFVLGIKMWICIEIRSLITTRIVAAPPKQPPNNGKNHKLAE